MVGLLANLQAKFALPVECKIGCGDLPPSPATQLVPERRTTTGEVGTGDAMRTTHWLAPAGLDTSALSRAEHERHTPPAKLSTPCLLRLP